MIDFLAGLALGFGCTAIALSTLAAFFLYACWKGKRL